MAQPTGKRRRSLFAEKDQGPRYSYAHKLDTDIEQYIQIKLQLDQSATLDLSHEQERIKQLRDSVSLSKEKVAFLNRVSDLKDYVDTARHFLEQHQVLRAEMGVMRDVLASAREKLLS